MDKKTSVFSNALIWFGAGVSIAEILIGTFIAELGFSKGIMAIVLGHGIGFFLMFFTGVIGGVTERSSMETVKMSFGQKGTIAFSLLNILQLVGWTAVMIISGASAVNGILSVNGTWIFTLIIGMLIIVWISVGTKNLNKINIVAMSALFILTIILSKVIFNGTTATEVSETITFGQAVEMSVAMPLSWLPLISDYTKDAKQPVLSSFVSALVYFFVSSWMYIIGLGATLFTGQSDIAKILVDAGLSVGALIVVIFSTTTTTFLDVNSAAISAMSISDKIKEKPTAIAFCILGVLIANFVPITEYESFLYIIGSVFAPMFAILLTDFFILKKDVTDTSVDFSNALVWLIGFVLYRVSLNFDTVVGNTLPTMIATSIICIIASKLTKKEA